MILTSLRRVRKWVDIVGGVEGVSSRFCAGTSVGCAVTGSQ